MNLGSKNTAKEIGREIKLALIIPVLVSTEAFLRFSTLTQKHKSFCKEISVTNGLQSKEIQLS